MKYVALVFVVCFSFAAFAQEKPKVRNHALATHHTIKASGRGFKRLGRELVAIPKDTVVGAFGALEASVDAFGVAVQGFADAVDMGIAAPLEALPKPLNEIGVGVHYVYEGVDAAGQFLAK